MRTPQTAWSVCSTAGLMLLLAVSAGADQPSLARPTPAQVAWHDLEVGMFIHFGPATWQGREYDDRSTPLSAINPERLDTEQWVRVAESLGAKYIMFVAKHTGGFCWWQTETSEYGVRNIPWRAGRGDVMRDLAESCRRHNLKLGVYLSPADACFEAELGGKCKTPEAQQRYADVYRRQLTELLSRYGEICEVWFDGSIVIDVADILRRHAPDAMIFQGPQATIRWVGNEEGHAPYPAWNALRSADARTGTATAEHSDPAGDAWLPLEVDTVSVNPHYWFWKATPERKLRSLPELLECYYRSVGHGAVLLLNFTPDTTGLIPEADARRAAEFGDEVQRRFGRSLAETAGDGDVLELAVPGSAPIDHVITMERIAEGERVREYVVEGRSPAGAWRELCRGTAIGHKKIDSFAPAQVSAIRLRVLKAAAPPRIRRLAVYAVSAPR